MLFSATSTYGTVQATIVAIVLYLPSAGLGTPVSSSASNTTVIGPSVVMFFMRHTVTVPLFSLTVTFIVEKSIPTTDEGVCMCVCDVNKVHVLHFTTIIIIHIEKVRVFIG